jgi:hypothetical protein
MDHRIVKDRDIPVSDNRSLDPALAADDCTPAADIECNAGTRTEFKGTGDREPTPEMSMGWNNKVPVYLHVPFKIRPFLRKKSIPFLEKCRHQSQGS